MALFAPRLMFDLTVGRNALVSLRLSLLGYCETRGQLRSANRRSTRRFGGFDLAYDMRNAHIWQNMFRKVEIHAFPC